jgi:hypothetical protein
VRTSTLVFFSTLFFHSVLAQASSAKSGVVNDAWYTMQVGSTPWGYFHETIERKENRFFYRYTMTKIEKTSVFLENIGAVAEADLTPVAFNLVKSGSGATEITDASYALDKHGGIFKLEVKGAKAARYERRVPKGTSLDVFFPVWLSQNWEKLKPGYKSWLPTFAEDPESGDFLGKTVKFEVGNTNTELGCLAITLNLDPGKAHWCMNREGALVDLKIAGAHVRRVKNEAEAKAFVAGVMPKGDKNQ